MRRMVEEPALKIRPMSREDLPEVIALQQAAFKNPWSPELLKRELDHDWSTILLVEGLLEGQQALLGFAIFWLVQVGIISVSAIGIGWRAVDRLIHGEATANAEYGIAVSAIAIVGAVWGLRRCRSGAASDRA